MRDKCKAALGLSLLAACMASACIVYFYASERDIEADARAEEPLEAVDRMVDRESAEAQEGDPAMNPGEDLVVGGDVHIWRLEGRVASVDAAANSIVVSIASADDESLEGRQERFVIDEVIMSVGGLKVGQEVVVEHLMPMDEAGGKRAQRIEVKEQENPFA